MIKPGNTLLKRRLLDSQVSLQWVCSQRSPTPAGTGNDQPSFWGKKKKFIPWMLLGYDGAYSSSLSSSLLTVITRLWKRHSQECVLTTLFNRGKGPPESKDDRFSPQPSQYNYTTKFRKDCQSQGQVTQVCWKDLDCVTASESCLCV